MPRFRGKPEGLLGQPFYGWLGGATITRGGRFQRPCSHKRKAAEAAFGKPRRNLTSRKTAGLLALGMARKRANIHTIPPNLSKVTFVQECARAFEADPEP